MVQKFGMKKIINYIIFLIVVFSILTIFVRLFLNPDSPTDYLQYGFIDCFEEENDPSCYDLASELSRNLFIFIIHSNIFLFFASLFYLIISTYNAARTFLI